MKYSSDSPAVATSGATDVPAREAPVTLSAADHRRYSRHLSLSDVGTAGQEKLKAARVLVIGTGGLGSPAALYLAAGGVGTLGLLDYDLVDESNLQRQVLYQSADVGSPKADTARQRLSALNPLLQLIAHQTELCAANVQQIFSGYDLIIDGTDRIATRYLINDACVLYRKTLVSAAIYRFEGQAMTYVPGRGPCYRCLFPQMADGQVPNCADVGVLGVLPGVLGTIQATEAIKVILGIGTALIGRLLTYDALEMRFDEYRFNRRADCAVCGEHPSINVPQDPPDFCTHEEQRRVRIITATMLAQRLASPGHDITLIDVREPHEFSAGHLTQAINLPLAGIAQNSATLPRQGTIVFVCRSGVRSLTACALVGRAGIQNPLQLQGGLQAWQADIEPSLVL